MRYPLCLLASLALLMTASQPASAGGEWVVIPESSTLTFSGMQGSAPFQGVFSQFTPHIVFDKENLAQSSIEVIVETASAKTGDAQIDHALPRENWMNTGVFPRAIFRSSNIVSTGTDKSGIENYVAKGSFSLMGITQELTIPFSLKPDGENTRAYGEVILNRLDFGIGKAVDARGDSVSKEIKVAFDITAHP